MHRWTFRLLLALLIIVSALLVTAFATENVEMFVEEGMPIETNSPLTGTLTIKKQNGLLAGTKSECEHIVICDSRSVCIKCDRTDLTEEEIYEVVHPYAYCYDLTKCGFCGETIEEGSVETEHSLQINAKYVPDEDGHRMTCYCGERVDTHILSHVVLCDQEDKSVCYRCGAPVADVEVDHSGETMFQDEFYHWFECVKCGMTLSPKVKHATYCDNPDGPCVTCGRPNDQCVIDEDCRGMHYYMYSPNRLIEEDGKYVHYRYCNVCETELVYHNGIVCNDYGSDVRHGVVCAECAYRFNDMKHSAPVIRNAREATCTKKGCTGDEICEDCGHIFKEGSEIDALGHEFEDGICTRCGARESTCNHIVTCEERTICTVCGLTDLIEEEISEVQHPYAFCYDMTKCGVCGETIPEGSVETVHSLDENVKYIPDEYVHWTTCFCGEVMDEEPFMHFAVCTQEDTQVCVRCGAYLENMEVDHINTVECQDEIYHWTECLDCGMTDVVPKVKHITYCFNPDGPCVVCGRPNDQCIFDEGNRGFHNASDSMNQVIEVDGEYVHYCYCVACGTDLAYHPSIVFEDFGDANTHKVYCAECGQTFYDMDHGKTVIRDAREATCTKKGYTGDEICEDCGHIFKEGTEIAALGHEFEDGICTRCGARESTCNHIVTCEERTICTVCGMTDLIDEEISEIQHLYAACYEPTRCECCGETIEEGTALETRHYLNIDCQAKFYPVGNMHRVTCYCGEVSGDELLPHQIICTQEDKCICDLCGGEAIDPYVIHFGEQIPMYDEYYHWVICSNCGENVSGYSKHYTSCTDPDALECAYCGVSTDECVIEDTYHGFHDNFDLLDERLIEEDGEYIHYCYCYACDTQVAYHHGIICNDFGDDVDHAVICAECGHQFNDMNHGNKMICNAKKATCTKNGYTGDEVCEDCGHIFKKGSVIYAMGHKFENGRCVRCGVTNANEGDMQVIKLGTSGLTMVVHKSYTSSETADEKQFMTYCSNVYTVDFDIYQWTKNEGETLNDIAIKEASEFGTECTETAVNGIPANYYEATATRAGTEQQFRAVIIENENTVIKIVFWMNGVFASSLVDTMVNTIVSEK